MTHAIWFSMLFSLIAGCGADVGTGSDPDPTDPDPTDPDPTDPTDPTDPEPDPTPGSTVTVTLVPRVGSGVQRVNFAVPLARGQLADADRVRVLAGGTEIAAARRALARHADGSIRSVQIQVDSDAAALEVHIDEAPATAALALVDVATTLAPADGSAGPRVWATLPASWLAATGVAGPLIPEADDPVDGAFAGVCDYADNGVDAFLALQTSKDVWLYDRGTAFYRAYARRGDRLTLESAYRETAIYRNGLTGSGAATRIGVPGAADDLKYHYAQNLAIHYLLTGDDRFRESAEDVAIRVEDLWSSPGYAGGDDFWTERHAGFALLAYVWASMVSDDRAADFAQHADAAVAAYLDVQAAGSSDPDARCFVHSATAHGEDYGTVGCSPWMSAILADGLDAYARERTGGVAANARAAIVELGTILARDGRDADGKPFYWMGLGAAADEVDPYDEHWGEPAYLVAMAWHHGGRTSTMLRSTVDTLVAGLAQNGSAPHLRSFNWQCRSAIALGYFLR